MTYTNADLYELMIQDQATNWGTTVGAYNLWMIDALASRVGKDGSWVNQAESRWSEGNSVLTTCYEIQIRHKPQSQSTWRIRRKNLPTHNLFLWVRMVFR